MPDLPLEVQQAMANQPIHTHRDLQELIASEKEKTATTEPPPIEEKPAKKTITKEDAAKATELLAKRLGFERPSPKEEKKEEKKDESTPKQEGKVPDSDKPTKGDKDGLESGVADGKDKPAEEPKAEEPPKKGKVSKKKEIDPVEIATHAATRAAQEVLQASGERSQPQPPRLEKSATPGDEHLSDEERDELAIFQEMAGHNPSLKSLPNQYLGYLKKAESYQRDWEKANPGEVFNPDDEAHNKFFESAQPKYSEREFRKAEARIAAREMIGREREETSKETAALKAQLALRELEPQIRNVQIGATAEIVKTVNEGWLESIKKDGFQKFAEVNPAEAQLIGDIAKKIGPFIAAAIAIDDPAGRIAYNPKDQSHQEWGEYLTAKENELRTKALKDRMTEDGRMIVSRAEFAQLPTTRRGSYAYLDADALINMRVAEEAERIQADYERKSKQLEAWAKAQGWSKQPVSTPAQTPTNGEVKTESEPEKKKEEVKSPEASSAARVDTSGSGPGITGDNLLDMTSKILFRR